jgi:hypothetical protein
MVRVDALAEPNGSLQTPLGMKVAQHQEARQYPLEIQLAKIISNYGRTEVRREIRIWRKQRQTLGTRRNAASAEIVRQMAQIASF